MIEGEPLGIKELEQVGIEKPSNFFKDMLQRAAGIFTIAARSGSGGPSTLPPAPAMVRKLV